MVYMNTNGHICINGKFLLYKKLPYESGCYIMHYKSISNVDAPQATSTFDQIEYLHALFSLGKQRSMKCIVTWKDCIPSFNGPIFLERHLWSYKSDNTFHKP